MVSNLKSLRELKAFDGEKYKTDIPRDEPLPKKCTHKDIKMISGSQLRCKCGVGYTGANIQKLFDILHKA